MCIRDRLYILDVFTLVAIAFVDPICFFLSEIIDIPTLISLNGHVNLLNDPAEFHFTHPGKRLLIAEPDAFLVIVANFSKLNFFSKNLFAVIANAANPLADEASPAAVGPVFLDSTFTPFRSSLK